jgi:hypothetical protein
VPENLKIWYSLATLVHVVDVDVWAFAGLATTASDIRQAAITLPCGTRAIF